MRSWPEKDELEQRTFWVTRYLWSFQRPSWKAFLHGGECQRTRKWWWPLGDRFRPYSMVSSHPYTTSRQDPWRLIR